jgi:tetratricopeptide (TPR) repeat protein
MTRCYPDAVKSAFVAACIVAAAQPAWADSEASELFEQGRVLKDQGDLVAACKLFEQSYDLERAAGTALNLADCEESAGNWEHALELYDDAAKVFEENGRAESARFARERAEKLRAARAPKPTPVPAAPRNEPQASNLALGIGIGGLTVSALGVVGWILAKRDIDAFTSTEVSGTGTFPPVTNVTNDDCGEVTFLDPQVQRKFETACDAADRQAWLHPVTLVSGTVGVVAIVYYLWTKPKRSKSIAVTPTASGGMVATFEW